AAAGDLFQKDGHAHAATPGGVQAVLDGDVVVGDDRVDLGALATGQLRGHLEVHDVAGVILDDVQDAGAPVDGRRRPRHLVGSRRGEDRTRTRRIEHAEPDVAAVHRLVAAAAARDQPDFALLGGVL